MKKIKITNRQYKAISLTYRIGGFLLILGLLLGYSILIGKPFEFLCLFLPYFFTKGLYDRQYHATSLKQCFVLSSLIFAFLTTITLPNEYSIVTALFIGLLSAYLSQKAGVIQFKLKDYAYIEPRYNQLVDFYQQHIDKPFDVDDCTKDELIDRCRKFHFSKENTNLAVMLFIDKLNQSKVADILNIEVHSVAMKKWRMKNILNSNEKAD